jgi:hypothetical protein
LKVGGIKFDDAFLLNGSTVSSCPILVTFLLLLAFLSKYSLSRAGGI